MQYEPFLGLALVILLVSSSSLITMSNICDNVRAFSGK